MLLEAAAHAWAHQFPERASDLRANPATSANPFLPLAEQAVLRELAE